VAQSTERVRKSDHRTGKNRSVFGMGKKVRGWAARGVVNPEKNHHVSEKSEVKNKNRGRVLGNVTGKWGGKKRGLISILTDEEKKTIKGREGVSVNLERIGGKIACRGGGGEKIGLKKRNPEEKEKTSGSVIEGSQKGTGKKKNKIGEQTIKNEARKK